MKDPERGILGEAPFERAVLGEDWLAAFLKEALPHLRILTLAHPPAAAAGSVQALRELLNAYDLHWESRLDYLTHGGIDAMDAETDRLRAEILKKVYAWQAFPAPQRHDVLTELWKMAIEWGPPGADDAVVMAAIKVLADNLPDMTEPTPEQKHDEWLAVPMHVRQHLVRSMYSMVWPTEEVAAAVSKAVEVLSFNLPKEP